MGKKNIAGAKQFISVVASKRVNHLVFGVGSNDLSEKETNTCVAEMKNLTTVHILPAFERVGELDFNEKVMKFNKESQQFCKNESKCEFIQNNELLNLFQNFKH